ncbi:MAG: RNA polymerase sigma factor [Planctomycetaceae bacterium]|nr:RNA polymerase sigma factor [Planctomycetaceae bacterium]
MTAPHPQALSSPAVSVAAGFDPVRLIETYQAGVWRYLRALGCEAAQAEDLTQDTFLAVLQRPFQDISPAATAAYLRKTALNLFISQQRRAGKVTAVEDVEELDRTWLQWAGNDDGEALLDALRDCLQGLTGRARMALEMRFRDNSSRDEIAAALEITDHGAKNLMQRAKHQLRECIQKKMK